MHQSPSIKFINKLFIDGPSLFYRKLIFLDEHGEGKHFKYFWGNSKDRFCHLFWLCLPSRVHIRPESGIMNRSVCRKSCKVCCTYLNGRAETFPRTPFQMFDDWSYCSYDMEDCIVLQHWGIVGKKREPRNIMQISGKIRLGRIRKKWNNSQNSEKILWKSRKNTSET